MNKNRSKIRRWCLSCVIAACLLSAVGAMAATVDCHVEPMPAATLLLPYFEVDLAGAPGITTGISVNNFSNQPVVANVVVRSDMGVFAFSFPIYLKAYDVQTINLRDVFVSGLLPQTSGTYPGCSAALPPPNLTATQIANYQAALTGHPVGFFGGSCAGRNLGDNIARGYITVDAMNDCTTLTQPNSGYFTGGGNGLASNQNVLWGDYYYEHPSTNQAEGRPLVHIKADVTNPMTSVPGFYTFYGKYVGWQSTDNRVPLATNFAARYFNFSTFTSDLVVWRDNKVAQGPFTCGAYPPWYPLGQAGITAFDEDSHSVTLLTNAFPAVAQRVHVGTDLPVPFSFGFLFLDLNTAVVGAGSNPPVDPNAAQAWVTETLIKGPELIGVDGIRLDSACSARHSGL